MYAYNSIKGMYHTNSSIPLKKHFIPNVLDMYATSVKKYLSI